MHADGPLRVVALVRDPEWEYHIRGVLGRSSIIRWVRDDVDFAPSAGLESEDVVVWHLDVGDRAVVAERAVPMFQRIRSAIPLSTIVLYCQLAPEVARLLLLAGRLGVDRVAFRGYDDLGRVVNEALRERRYAGAVGHILTLLDLPDSRAVPVLAQVIRHAFHTPVNVEQLARELGIDRKTLHNRLRSAGLPSAAAVISWSRLFAAGWFLDHSTQTVASVGRSLRFTSTSELRGMITRYVHSKPTDLRRRGALRSIVQAFRVSARGA